MSGVLDQPIIIEMSARGSTGPQGETGNGIASIAKTGETVLVDHYTITYTNGTTTTFDVTNGKGITSIVNTSSTGLVDHYTITYNDGTTQVYDVENGNGIESYEKTGTDVLVDHYLITFTNGQTKTIDVTNGNGIASISKTGTNVLTDTYTISYTNGTTATFDVVNGNGISTVTKTGSTSLTDHYRIDFTNGTNTTYDVANGKGIVSIEKTGTAGLVDTYTVTYNDSTTSTFTVTNGAKGDTGNGIASITKTGTSGLVDTYTVTMTDGTSTTFTVTNGAKGDTGNGIASIAKTGTVGAVDTYTITMTDGTTATFTVTNGSDTWGAIVGDLEDQTDLQDVLDEKALAISESASGSIVSISDGTPTPVSALTVNIEPVQSGNGDPSPSNVRPITGWTGANVYRTGKNLYIYNIDPGISLSGTANGLDYTINADGSIDISGTANANGIIYVSLYGRNSVDVNVLKKLPYKLEPSEQISVCLDGGSANCDLALQYNQSDGSLLTTTTNYEPMVRTIPSNAVYVYIGIRLSNLVSGTSYNYHVKPMIARSSTALPYEAPQVTTLPISWQSEAGTVYGGTLDVLTGTLTVTYAIVTVDGTENWNWTTSSVYVNRFTCTPGVFSPTENYQNFLSNYLRSTAWGAEKNTFAIKPAGTIYIMLDPNATQMTVAEFNTYLANNNLQICYELATPLTVQLTPSQLSLLQGDNNIWADTGDIALTYRADTKTYIDNKIAESVLATRSMLTNVETSMTATRDYSTGQIVIVGNDVLKLTSNVGSGTTLVIGTNCTKVTIADWVLSLIV